VCADKGLCSGGGANEFSAIRTRSKITLHFVISSSSHFWHILKIKNLEIAYNYSAFCSLKYTKPNLVSVNKIGIFVQDQGMLKK